jgi:hypothetical protein
MKMIVFWDFAPCSLVDIDRRWLVRSAEDGGNKHLWNVGKYALEYTVQRAIKSPPLKFYV